MHVAEHDEEQLESSEQPSQNEPEGDNEIENITSESESPPSYLEEDTVRQYM